MGDFKSFRNQYGQGSGKAPGRTGPNEGQSGQKAAQGGPNTGKGGGTGIPFDRDTVMDFAKQYENSSEQEILSDLLKTAQKSKANGTFDFNQMEQFADTLSGVLNDEQRKRLGEVMKMLKNT